MKRVKKISADFYNQLYSNSIIVPEDELETQKLLWKGGSFDEALKLNGEAIIAQSVLNKAIEEVNGHARFLLKQISILKENLNTLKRIKDSTVGAKLVAKERNPVTGEIETTKLVNQCSVDVVKYIESTKKTINRLEDELSQYHAKTSQSIQWMVEGDFILIRECFSYKVVKRINISRFGGAVRLDAHEEM